MSLAPSPKLEQWLQIKERELLRAQTDVSRLQQLARRGNAGEAILGAPGGSLTGGHYVGCDECSGGTADRWSLWWNMEFWLDYALAETGYSVQLLSPYNWRFTLQRGTPSHGEIDVVGECYWEDFIDIDYLLIDDFGNATSHSQRFYFWLAYGFYAIEDVGLSETAWRIGNTVGYFANISRAELQGGWVCQGTNSFATFLEFGAEADSTVIMMN